MESFVSFSTLFNLVLTVIWFISGIRDLQGKDPFLDLPFNQYHRDPEYRAFWQKKNGVFYMLNSIAFLILAFTPVTSLLYRIIFGIALWETFFILSLTKAGTIVRIDSRKGATMNLNLSGWDWLTPRWVCCFCTAASGICTMHRHRLEHRGRKETLPQILRHCFDHRRRVLAGQHFSAKGRAAALHFDGGSARVVRCPADLVSVLCPEQGRQNKK